MNRSAIRLSLLCLLLAGLASGCAAQRGNPGDILPGMSRADVTNLLGRPDAVNAGTLPEGPFFGPQESLTAVLPPGADYEEWIYPVGEDDCYVWFAGEGARENWRVVLTAAYPRDAVF
jgi:hypothetical protein